jgi:hypothetical protein
VEENKQAAELPHFFNLKRERHPMQLKTGTTKGTENLDKRASNSWHTAQHAAIYIGLGLAGVFSPVANPALAASDVVISQVYGGSGGSGAPFKQDFIELFNRG